MQITLNIDDDLLSQAKQITGVFETTALIRASLIALIEIESAKQLARLGGTEPNLQPVQRRRSDIV
jgi:Arc/MetJ family transcription regulator